MRKFLPVVFAIVVAFCLVATAQDQPPAPGQGPGNQAAPPPPGGGFGPGMRNRMGRGPEMMGPGMMGPRFQGPPDVGDRGPRFGRRFGPRSRMQPGMRGERFGRAFRDLNLTGTQQTKLRQLRFDQQKAAIQNRAALETKELELRQLMRSEKPDRAAVNRTIEEIGQLRSARMKAAMEARFAFHDLLTPEQQQKLRQFRDRGPERDGSSQPRARTPGPRRRATPPPASPSPRQ